MLVVLRVRVQIRLNDGSDYCVARPVEEELLLTACKESWTRRAGKEARYQRIGIPLIVFDHGEIAHEEEKMRRHYPQRRADFMKGYGNRLEKAGKTWDDLKIDFIRIEGVWPK